MNPNIFLNHTKSVNRSYSYKKNYNVSKTSVSCGRASSEIDSNFKSRQTKKAGTKTKRQYPYMVELTLRVERKQSDNKGKIDTKKALTNRNLHCKETIQCNLIAV